MLKKMFLWMVCMLCFLNMTCEEDAVNSDDAVCETSVLIDAKVYETVGSTSVKLGSSSIDGDCLSLVIGASGCDGNSWVYNLIDSGAVAESLPEQRFLKLDFTNKEVCLAFIEKMVHFDLTPLRINGSNEIILHIDGLNESMTYSY